MRLTRSSPVSLRLLRCSVAAFGILTAPASAEPPASGPLPEAPEGIRVRALASFGPDDQEPVRIAAQPGTGRLFVLGGGGDVTAIDPKSGAMRRVLEGKDYIDRPADQTLNIPLPVDAKVVNAPITLRSTLCLGIAFDRQWRLYVTANVQVPGKTFINRVCLYRTSPVGTEGDVPRPELWTRFDHPYGIGGFNHGAGRIAQGPDGMIYLGSGSRTDHGEAGDEPNMSRLGEGPHPDVSGGPGIPPGRVHRLHPPVRPGEGPAGPRGLFARQSQPVRLRLGRQGEAHRRRARPDGRPPRGVELDSTGRALRLPLRLRRRRGSRLHRWPQGPRGGEVRLADQERRPGGHPRHQSHVQPDPPLRARGDGLLPDREAPRAVRELLLPGPLRQPRQLQPDRLRRAEHPPGREKGASWSPTPNASSTAWAGRSTSASATASCTSSSTAARARPSGRGVRATRPADACSKSPRAREMR